jgi:hypothetical protein
MVARNRIEELIGEWLSYGGEIVYKNEEITVLKKDNEFFIKSGKILVHVIPGKMIAAYSGKWYVTHKTHRSGNKNNTTAVRIA